MSAHDRDAVAACGIEGLPIPGGISMLNHKALRVARTIKFIERIAPVELKSSDHSSLRRHVSSTRTDKILAVSGSTEDRHVPGEQDQVEGAAKVKVGEVALVPLDRGFEIACFGEHRGADVDADHFDAVAQKLDRHPSGAAASIEDGAGIEGEDEASFAMKIDPLGLKSIKSGLIARSVELLHLVSVPARGAPGAA